MSQQDLSDYIKRAREQHASDDTIRSQLLKFGWSPVEVDSALGQKEELGITLPPPPAPHIGMWISFQYVLLFIALYIAATSLGGILNLAADKNITDPLDNINYYSSTFSPNIVRGYMAALLVAYPIFAFLFLRLTSQLLSKPFLRGLRARKILIYLTLVITFIIMISHIIYILYNLLSGSVTGRSAAHLGVTLLIAGSIFGYLLQDVREDRKGL